jgi:cellobiose-specific phosphotransferase system component IIC
MDDQHFANIANKLAQAQLAAAQAQLTAAEELLTIKKVRWYEVFIFGGVGITIGLALAKIFMV